MKIYYAHHQWKYGTPIEKYEMDLIKWYFSRYEIINPSTDIEREGKTEDEIMENCLSKVRDCDMVVFSSMDGMIGKGVYHEINEARCNNKPVFYINQECLTPYQHLQIVKNRYPMVSDISDHDRVYAFVYQIGG